MKSPSALLITIWLALAALILLVASPGVSQNTHVTMAALIGAALIILSRFDKSPLARILFLSLAGFIVARYIIWRSMATLTFHDHLSFTFAIVLFIAELYGVAIFFLGAIANIKPFKSSICAKGFTTHPRLKRHLTIHDK